MRADPLQLKVLESFIHPLVSEAREAFFQTHQDADIVVMDIPLLFETGLDKAVHKIVVVTAPAHIQRQRVMARQGMTADLFKSLLARQTPDAEKRKRAQFLIFTDRGLESAREQVQEILRELRAGS
jgi:dephospho-CoA kinase